MIQGCQTVSKKSRAMLNTALIWFLDIEHAFQSLALDEKRITFPPTLWHKTSDKQHLEQCWFPGVHANVGGQAEYPMFFSDRSELAANTFAWMVRSLSNKCFFANH